MNLETIVQSLHLKVKSGEGILNVEVRGGYVGDLLSDVMANSHKGDLLITRQVHQNIVAVASLNELAGIVLVQGAEPAAETLEKAAREKIPLLVAELPAFEVAGRIYQMIEARGTRPM
jgi:predicted transcriptional regulator